VGENGPVSNIVSGGNFKLGAGFWAGFNALAIVDVPLQEAEALPTVNDLSQNSPNPFRGPTSIAFAVSRPSPVRLTIYDVSGRAITTLASGSYSPGRYGVDWRGEDDRGTRVAGGVYFYRLDIGPWSQTRKMLKLQ
jgi:FlgD Ig-like domain